MKNKKIAIALTSIVFMIFSIVIGQENLRIALAFDNAVIPDCQEDLTPENEPEVCSLLKVLQSSKYEDYDIGIEFIPAGEGAIEIYKLARRNSPPGVLVLKPGFTNESYLNRTIKLLDDIHSGIVDPEDPPEKGWTTCECENPGDAGCLIKSILTDLKP